MIHGAFRWKRGVDVVVGGLLDPFSALADPRQGWRVLYPLPEILLVVPCATLAGMEDFVEIKLWGDQRLDFLRRLSPYERGVPSHDVLTDVISALDPEVFKDCFTSWVEGLRDDGPEGITAGSRPRQGAHHHLAKTGPAPGSSGAGRSDNTGRLHSCVRSLDTTETRRVPMVYTPGVSGRTPSQDMAILSVISVKT